MEKVKSKESSNLLTCTQSEICYKTHLWHNCSHTENPSHCFTCKGKRLIKKPRGRLARREIFCTDSSLSSNLTSHIKQLQGCLLLNVSQARNFWLNDSVSLRQISKFDLEMAKKTTIFPRICSNGLTLSRVLLLI